MINLKLDHWIHMIELISIHMPGYICMRAHTQELELE